MLTFMVVVQPTPMLQPIQYSTVVPGWVIEAIKTCMYLRFSRDIRQHACVCIRQQLVINCDHFPPPPTQRLKAVYQWYAYSTRKGIANSVRRRKRMLFSVYQLCSKYNLRVRIYQKHNFEIGSELFRFIQLFKV